LPPWQGPQDGNHQSAAPEKVGWVRKFCGKGIFREIWKNRYVVLKGDQLYISEKEVGVLRLNYPCFLLSLTFCLYRGWAAFSLPLTLPPILFLEQVQSSP
jgi:hypothetical protein